MGKIRKTASPKHEATLSPFVHAFVTSASSIPLCQLPSHLSTFPRPWPFMRGDLYHWIPVLNRFDDILETYNRIYELDKGPQAQAFGRQCTLSGVGSDAATDEATLDGYQLPRDADRIIVEDVLRFTTLLYENCANRALYASSQHLSTLLNTTSLSILDLVLRLSLRLAHRYCTERVRMSSGPYLGHIHPPTLVQHYMIDLEKIAEIAQPAVRNLTGHSERMLHGSGLEIEPSYAPSLLSLASNHGDMWEEFGRPWISFQSDGEPNNPDPSSPSPGQRHPNRASNLGPGRLEEAGQPSASTTVSSPSQTDRGAFRELRIENASDQSLPELVKEYMPQVSEKYRYTFLCRMRAAIATSQSAESRNMLLCIRLAAIANLAYIQPESHLEKKLTKYFRTDSSRQTLPENICALLSPPTKQSASVPISIQAVALKALDALTSHQKMSAQLSTALGVTVNHGILTYFVRKAVAYMKRDDETPESPDDGEWMDSLFTLLHDLPKSMARAGENFVAAGLLSTFVESLAFRTRRSAIHRHRVLGFLDVFVYNTRDAFNSMINAGGLDLISDLLGYEVTTALQSVQDGHGLPENWKKASTYAKVPYVQQQSLRTLIKLVKNMMSIGGAFDRVLRNLIESSQILASLRTVIIHASTFGANVWCGAVELFSQFIHNEPTSYTTIAEAGLTKAFLESMTNKASSDTLSGTEDIHGILPTAEAICVIPTAFSAICLNEAGMKHMQEYKAIETFFSTISKPSHLKALALTSGEPENIGGSFDELVRHHPTLRSEIVRNIVSLTEHLRTILTEEEPDLELAVPGRAVKSIPNTSAALRDADVEMTDAQGMSHEAAPRPNSQCPRSPVATDRLEPTVVVCGILHGFFRNSTLCASFADAGGIIPLIDVAAAPRWDMMNHRGQAPIARVLRTVIHHKPHLTTPLLVHRLQSTLEHLRSFIELDANGACFLHFITTSAHNDDGHLIGADPDQIGSDILKHLYIARNIILILTKSFTDMPHRTSAHPIAGVNMADMYIELVQILGKLQARLIWEYALLQSHAPDHFRSSEMARNILDVYKSPEEITAPVNPEQVPSSTEDTNNVNGSQDSKSEFSSNAMDDMLCKQNFSKIREILGEMPGEIASFLQTVSRSILVRRISSSDVYQKRCVHAVANSIAEAVIEVLDLPKTIESHTRAADYYSRTSVMVGMTAMMDKGRETSQQPLTLVMWQFKKLSGFERLLEIGKRLLSSSQNLAEDDASRTQAPSPLEGLHNLILFFSLLSDSKNVNDAMQTAALSSRSEREKERPDYFSAAQLLVEFRMYAMLMVLPIWRSDQVITLPSEVVEGVCEILQNVFEASTEHGAYLREDQVSTEQSSLSRTWRPRSPDAVNPLIMKGYPGDLALEALYRCSDGTTAQEYCEQRTKSVGVPRFLPPKEEMAPIERDEAPTESSTSAVEPSSSTDPITPSARPMDAPPQDVQELINNLVDSRELPISTGAASTSDPAQPAAGVSANATSAPHTPTQPKSTKQRVADTGIMTLEDLNELRSTARESLVDRSLFVLSKFDGLSFALADLIVASVAQSSDAATMRTDISQTLVQSLISYQGSGNVNEESSKIASGAHLLGVVLQDKEFFDCAKDDLKENVNALCQYVEIAASQQQDNKPVWISNILLILERLLAEDAQPSQIKWSPHQSQASPEDDKVAELKDPIVTQQDRDDLFAHTIGILPHIGKDTALGTAVLRILVCLTRSRDIAERLSLKSNLQKLFVMVKQLSTVASKRLRGTFMLILRNIVEDDETVKQVMRSEIRTLFEKQPRPFDTTAYARHLYHCVLRHPESFVSVTNELVMLPSYDRNQTPQIVALKKDEPLTNDAWTDDSKVAASVPLPSESANGVTGDIHMSAEPQDAVDEAKATELKPPVLTRSDGITNFILSELLAYKDVQDSKPVSESAKKAAQATDATTSEDTNMEGGDGPTDSDPEQTPKAPEDSKHVFKTGDHPIFVYRCFLLQMLTELLQSYTCCKINFLNFSRKAEPQAGTPSKPRSGVLNYLLNGLIPALTLQHSDDDSFKIKVVTSHQAVSLIVALCARTTEKGAVRRRDTLDTEDEPDLVFVRKFVLEHALKAYKESHPTDSLEASYSRYHGLATLFNRLLAPKPNNAQHRYPRSQDDDDNFVPTQKQIAKIMFEKNYAVALTTSLSDIDANVPGADRAIRHILRPLKLLTHTAIELSLSGDVSTPPGQTTDDDAISSATSVSDQGEGREETPDLFRNSTLGMFEPGREDALSTDSSAEDDEEAMYGDEYADDMEFDEEDPAHDGDDVMSDEDEAMEGVGSVEGLDGDVPMDVQIDMAEEELDHNNRTSSDDSDDLPASDNSGSDDEDDDDDDLDDEDDVVEVMEEINGDNENASMPGDEDEAADEWEDEDHDEEEEMDYDAEEEFNAAEARPVDVMDEGSEGDANPYPGAVDEDELLGDEAALNAFQEHLEIGLEHDEPVEQYSEEDDEEDPEEEDEDDMEEEEIVLGGHTHEDDDGDMPPYRWGWPTPHRRHHHHRHGHPWGLPLPRAGGTRDRLFAMPGFRTHRQPPNVQANEDGSNPLLNRANNPRMTEHGGSPLARHPLHPADPGRHLSHQDILARLERDLLGGPAGFPFLPNLPPHIESALVEMVGHHPGHGTFNMRTGPGGHTHELEYVIGDPRPRHMHGAPTTREDPASAVRFETTLTEVRWQEAARLLFGPSFVEKSQKVVNALLKLLVPPAIERDRINKLKQEAEVKRLEEVRAKAEKERAEAEAQAKTLREEQEAKEAAEKAEADAEAARLAAEAQNEASTTQEESTEQADEAMEGVEESAAPASPAAADAEPSEAQPRVMIQIRGRELDITDLGIDTAYLDALPEEMREEVILQQVAEHRSTAAAAGEGPTSINNEFLDALPPDIREELLQQEASDRRRQEREAARRQAQAQGAPPQPEEIDPATFIASLDPVLRQQVLAESDEDMLAALPADMAAEARALGGRHRRGAVPPAYMFGNALHTRPDTTRTPGHGEDRAPKASNGKAQRRPIIQMLDKAGIATLLRLMFLLSSEAARSSVQGILMNACGNRQTRGEVVHGLLSILTEGCTDAAAVERYYAHLTHRAKPSTAPKTPQSAKKQSFQIGPNTSPEIVIAQCLQTLFYLADSIPTIPQFFLTEHDVSSSIKSKAKGKGKAKDTKASRYPFVSLLSLLERQNIMDRSQIMTQLSGLLSLISRPLGELIKKEQAKEKSDQEAKAKAIKTTSASAAETSATPGANGGVQASAIAHAAPELQATSEPQAGSSAAGALRTNDAISTESQTNDEASTKAPVEGEANQKEAESKKHQPLTMPDVPPEMLKPMVNILMAKECPSEVFRHTITTLTNFSAIPGAKQVFRDELLKHAKELGVAITASLKSLIEALKDVETEMQAQTAALVDFSPTGSDQTKFSRVITALNYLTQPSPRSQSDAEKKVEDPPEANLLSLIEDDVFMQIWEHLSLALQATKRSETDYYFNVATVLLPMIETLLIVCKRIPFSEVKSTKRPVSQPQEGSGMREVFFTFTTKHKKILNDLVRQNPKLMNATFSALVKNSTVLEFDNKRNFFNRQLHHRTGDVRPHPTLQLNVRRDQVFLDSYKNLHFKTPQEIKYGKFNIRFHNEEGVDAGGVTREWFQVLARQMFNPDYALFNPVASDRTTFHPNNLSWINQEHLQFFKFIGRIIGKALYENRVLDCHFSRAVYKKLLGQPVSLKDMETVDLEYSKNMDWMLHNDITDIITETFSLAQDKFGMVEVIDLIPNGRSIPVTEENKDEYVRKVIEYRLTGSVQEQLDSFLKGFYDIVSPDLVSIFDEGELELLISGMPDVDVDDWKANTDYHNYQTSSHQIQWFWRALRSFDKEEKARLLQFVTGTGKVPLNGFKELEGMNGFTRFSIHKDYGSTDRLPSSHTCFNQLDLPEYDNYESLRKNLYTAMTTGNEYFGYA